GGCPGVGGGIGVDREREGGGVKGRHRGLPPREFQLLKLLVEAKGKVLSREHILEKIWGYDRGLELSTRTVDQHVARLRGKLRPEGDRIATVKSYGYQIKLG